MKKRVFSICILLFSFFLLVGCAHNISNGFDVYLKEHPSSLSKINIPVSYSIDPNTQNMVYSFRCFSTGIANKWIIKVGDMLKDYLEIKGPQIFKEFVPYNKDSSIPIHIDFAITNYAFKGFQAYVGMKITVYKNNQLLFAKNYNAIGVREGGKIFWGGAYAQRYAVHQSSQSAFDSIMTQFLNDLKHKLS